MHDVNLKDNYKEMDTKKSTQFVIKLMKEKTEKICNFKTTQTVSR